MAADIAKIDAFSKKVGMQAFHRRSYEKENKAAQKSTILISRLRIKPDTISNFEKCRDR